MQFENNALNLGTNQRIFFFIDFFSDADKSKQCMRLSTLCLYTGNNPIYKKGLYKC